MWYAYGCFVRRADISRDIQQVLDSVYEKKTIELFHTEPRNYFLQSPAKTKINISFESFHISYIYIYIGIRSVQDSELHNVVITCTEILYYFYNKRNRRSTFQQYSKNNCFFLIILRGWRKPLGPFSRNDYVIVLQYICVYRSMKKSIMNYLLLYTCKMRIRFVFDFVSRDKRIRDENFDVSIRRRGFQIFFIRRRVSCMTQSPRDVTASAFVLRKTFRRTNSYNITHDLKYFIVRIL